jgi:hypothetical protein
MWEDAEAKNEVLQDAVFNLEYKNLEYKKRFESQAHRIRELEGQVEYYKAHSFVAGDIHQEPTEIDLSGELQESVILNQVATVSLTDDPIRRAYHVVGKYYEPNNVQFKYFVTKDSITMDNYSSVLSYLHKKVLQEIKRRIK